MDHSAWCVEHCRVCGGRLGRFKVSYQITEHQDKLQAIGVLVKGDKEGTNSVTLATMCALVP